MRGRGEPHLFDALDVNLSGLVAAVQAEAENVADLASHLDQDGTWRTIWRKKKFDRQWTEKTVDRLLPERRLANTTFYRIATWLIDKSKTFW